MYHLTFVTDAAAAAGVIDLHRWRSDWPYRVVVDMSAQVVDT
jgi:hypothetical protein